MEDIKVMQPSDGNKFYMCTVVIDAENPDNGKPKKQTEVHLIEGPTVGFVEKKVTEQMTGTMFSWHIKNIIESKIQFVY